MKIETPRKLVKNSQNEIFTFLCDLNNFEQLLPQDKIENWSSTNEECTFRIKGMTDIGLKKVDSTPDSLINLVSHGKVPFNFTLNLHLSAKEDNLTEAYLLFDGDINPFMKMMVEKPLTNFFGMLVDKLVEINQ